MADTAAIRVPGPLRGHEWLRSLQVSDQPPARTYTLPRESPEILVKDKKKKKQNEGLQSPAEKTPEEKDISPEINKIAASSSLFASCGRRALFTK